MAVGRLGTYWLCREGVVWIFLGEVTLDEFQNAFTIEATQASVPAWSRWFHALASHQTFSVSKHLAKKLVCRLCVTSSSSWDFPKMLYCNFSLSWTPSLG